MKNQVFESLKNTESIGDEINETTTPIFQRLVDGVIDQISEEKFDEIITIESICGAKVIVLETAIKSGFIADMCKASKNEGFADIMQSMMNDLVEIIKPIASNALAYMKENGVNESDVLKAMGMSEKTLEMHKKGEVTLRYVFLNDPVVIFKNT